MNNSDKIYKLLTATSDDFKLGIHLLLQHSEKDIISFFEKYGEKYSLFTMHDCIDIGETPYSEQFFITISENYIIYNNNHGKLRLRRPRDNDRQIPFISKEDFINKI